MKNDFRLLAALTSATVLLSCGSSSEQRAEDHVLDGASTQVEDSVRWQANPETIEGIRGMQALVAGYPSNGLASGVLRDSLEARMALIFERCTMEGEAHEALHTYLLPLISALRTLPDEPTSVELDSIAGHLGRFDEQFH